jgi:hypothetical protein
VGFHGGLWWMCMRGSADSALHAASARSHARRGAVLHHASAR